MRVDKSQTMKQEQDTAKNIAAALDRGASSLQREVLDQLAAARNQAVAAMPARVAATEPALAGVGKFFAFHFHGQRLWYSMGVMLGAVLLAFVLLHSMQNREPVGADALLLGSDLPPEAYLDKGFDAWLEQSSRH